MKFRKDLVHGFLVKRYKRFLADVELDNGNLVTAHCTNSGSMLSCLEEGAEVYLSPANDPARKTQFTWEMIHIGGGWVGVNTSNPNMLAFEWINEGILPGLEGIRNLKREVKFEDSRFDLFGEDENGGVFIEVKNVTLKQGKLVLFPDAVTARGLKHLETLGKVQQSGMRAVMLYVVQRMDVEAMAPARDIDPEYATALLRATQKGVEVIVARAKVSPTSIVFDKLLPLNL